MSAETALIGSVLLVTVTSTEKVLPTFVVTEEGESTMFAAKEYEAEPKRRTEARSIPLTVCLNFFANKKFDGTTIMMKERKEHYYTYKYT